MSSRATTPMQSDLATRVYNASFGSGSESDCSALTICLVIPLLILLHYFIIMPVVFGSLSHVPGPIPCKLSGYYLSYFNISLQRTRKIYEWHAKYGPVICVGPEEVSVATPSLMREIYGSSGRYTKSSFFDQFVTYGERAVFAIRPYLAHREKRKPIVSFYYNVKKPWIESFINERVDAIVSHIDSKQDEISLDVYALVSHFAFDNISRLLYGERRCSHTIEIDGEERRILAALRQAQLWGPFHSDFPRLHGIIGKMASLLSCGSAPLHADDDLSRWNYDLVNELITTHSTEKNTLFHHLLNTETPDKTPRSLNYIASELYDNVNAAQITVATTLVYIIYHLSENPEWQVKIRDEILALSSEASGFPSFASIDSAPILDACIREVYRINPGTGGHAERVVPEGGKVFDSIYVPGGVRLSLASFLR